jgi:hypothetical protein
MRKKDATITAWLRNRISHLDYGLKWRGGVVHCNTNETVLCHLRTKSRLSHLTNEKLSRHFSGTDTFYFAGNSWGDETLVMIDIDCHDGIGSLQGAFAYAEFLKDTFFPNLYFEPSTNGKGVHGYFVLDKKDVRPETVNDLLGQLQVVLRQTTTGFDIQTVEIKGRCPVVIWGRRRGEVANYKAGTLAKIPRQAERFEELKNTTRLAVKELIALVPRRILRGNEKPTIRFAAKPKPVTAKAQAPRVLKTKDQAVGSCSDRVISSAEVQKLTGHYLKVAETLLGAHPIRTGRVVATAEDLAIFLMLLKWFTKNMNSDGSLPWARFKGLWDALHEAGDISRAFDAKRFAAVRNYLSSLGLIEWKENTFHTGFWSQGSKMPGKACKWKAGETLMKMLEEEEKEKRDNETSLAGTHSSNHLQQLVESLEMLPIEQTTRPIWTIPLPFQRPSIDELAKLLGWAA